MKLPKDIAINGKRKRFEEIHTMFAKTGYGMILNQRVRWSYYKTRETSHGAWERLIGNDANNLKHLLVAYHLTREFLQAEGKYSEKEQELLLFTAIVHDWAEPVVGDIMRYMKTAKNDNSEFVVLSKIMKEVFYGKMDEKLERKVLEILAKRKARLGEAFRVIEVIGYLKIGVLAWKKAKSRKGEVALRLKWLVSNVLLADTDFMIGRADGYKFVSDFLKKHQAFFDNAFKYMPIEVFDFHPVKKRDGYFRKFQAAKKDWVNYNKLSYGNRSKNTA